MDISVGSGSTPIAALKSGRKFIGCEFGEEEYQQALERIKSKTANF